MVSTRDTGSGGKGDGGRDITLRERLDYMADLILELKHMAEQAELREVRQQRQAISS
jgi:hypothetical protein